MRNRWFYRPHLHTQGSGEKRVNWLEILYDLIFAAAYLRLGVVLAGDVTFARCAEFAGVFSCLWIVWTGFAFYSNRFDIDDFVHRILVLVQMFAVGSMALFASRVLDGDRRPFASAYAAALALGALMQLRAWFQVPMARRYCRYWGSVFAVGAALWSLSLVVPEYVGYGLWLVATLVIFGAPLSRASRGLQEELPTDQTHLSERYGLLTLIVLGESFVVALSSMNGDVAANGHAFAQMSTTLLITCCLWWIYFDDVAGAPLRRHKFAPTLWLYAHLPMLAAITAVGVAAKNTVRLDLQAPAPEAHRWLLSGGLAIVLASVALIDSVTQRRQVELSDRARINVRVASAVLVLVLAPAGSAMSAGMFMVLVATICVAQVIFDMMMAPLEAIPDKLVHPTVAELAHQREAGSDVAPVRRRDVSETVRRGAPSRLRRDFYFYVMEGSWKRFFAVLIFLYVLVNVFFGALYALEPGCIDGASPESFGDAFFFSVQTFSTIGYGALSPATSYADALVTAEAAVGMLSVALATGLTFAKASQPRSGALFSDVIVVTRRDGVDTLSLRVGNARGNDVVDATITMTLIADEITPEGEHMRRLHELQLLRDRTPVFALSWTVLHAIDENSPMAAVNWNKLEGATWSIVVTLIGHDGTYGQTVYARRLYYPEDVRPGHRFVDVVSQLPDGRLLIDYERFHDTEALDAE